MTTATIAIQVDAESARAFQQAPEEERRRLEVLLGLRLRELMTRPARPLGEIMDEIGAKAESLGLTPEMVSAMLTEPLVAAG